MLGIDILYLTPLSLILASLFFNPSQVVTQTEQSRPWERSKVAPLLKAPAPFGDFQCPGSGYFLQPGTCTTFYKCFFIGLKPLSTHSCAHGQKFDLIKRRCDLADKVNCSDNGTSIESIQNPGQNQTELFEFFSDNVTKEFPISDTTTTEVALKIVTDAPNTNVVATRSTTPEPEKVETDQSPSKHFENVKKFQEMMSKNKRKKGSGGGGGSGRRKSVIFGASPTFPNAANFPKFKNLNFKTNSNRAITSTNSTKLGSLTRTSHVELGKGNSNATESASARLTDAALDERTSTTNKSNTVAGLLEASLNAQNRSLVTTQRQTDLNSSMVSEKLGGQETLNKQSANVQERQIASAGTNLSEAILRRTASSLNDTLPDPNSKVTHASTSFAGTQNQKTENITDEVGNRGSIDFLSGTSAKSSSAIEKEREFFPTNGNSDYKILAERRRIATHAEAEAIAERRKIIGNIVQNQERIMNQAPRPPKPQFTAIKSPPKPQFTILASPPKTRLIPVEIPLPTLAVQVSLPTVLL